MKPINSSNQKPESIPDGLELVSAEDGTDYLVPELMVPMSEHVRDVREQKSALKVGLQDGGSGNPINSYHERLALGNVIVPADPDLTDRERLSLHVEIKALQERLGLSYKDAAHQLYIAEVEKLNMSKTGYKAFSSLREHVESSLENNPYANADL